MEFSHLSLIGAFAMLVLGVVEYAMLQRLLYLPMRQRFERAKVTAQHKLDPDTFWMIMKLSSFVVLPAIGFLFGDTVLRPLLG